MEKKNTLNENKIILKVVGVSILGISLINLICTLIGFLSIPLAMILSVVLLYCLIVMIYKRYYIMQYGHLRFKTYWFGFVMLTMSPSIVGMVLINHKVITTEQNDMLVWISLAFFSLYMVLNLINKIWLKINFIEEME